MFFPLYAAAGKCSSYKHNKSGAVRRGKLNLDLKESY